MKAQIAASEDEAVVLSIYYELLECWNRKSAANFAFLFTDDALVIGFDGSQMTGRAGIEIGLNEIFVSHETGSYVGKVRGVRPLSKKVILLTAVAGMIPHNETDLKPEINALQTLVAVRNDKDWKVALFQNTPAKFHGRPELAEALTTELREQIKK